jgi:hypothetical protein
MSYRFSARNIPNSVTHYPLVYLAQDAAGGRKKTWPAGTDLMASVQVIDPIRHGAYQGATRSEADAVAYFGDPIKTTVDDQLVWHVSPGDATQDRLFGVLGPATPEAGRGSLYAVPLKEIR